MSERALKFLVFIVFRIRTPCHLPSCVKHSFIPWILAELWIWQTRPWPLWSFYATEMYKRQVNTYIYQILSDIDKCFVIVVHLLSRVLLFVTPWSAALGHRLPCPSLSLGVFWNSYPLSQWCHPAILSSVIPFSSCPHSFPASESFSMSRLFTSGGQSIGASASASVLPVNIQDWFPLALTDLISLLSKDSEESSPAPQLESINSVLSLLYDPTLTSVRKH